MFWTRFIVVGMFTACCCAQNSSQSTTFPVGEPVPVVKCQGDESQSYALYLPTGFTAERQWPLLFVFDPRKRGMVGLELFREGAERYGYMIASSNNFVSDTNDGSFAGVLASIWDDAANRLPVNPKRVYATGFSGGARISWTMARFSPVPFAGIIGAGAGLPWPETVEQTDTSSLSFVGMVGRIGFNYYEMLELDRKLDRTEIPHRLMVFSGRHQWPPRQDATEALRWMQVQGMRRGLIAKDDGFLEATYRERLAEAAASEKEGHALEAYEQCADLAEDFSGLLDNEAASSCAERLKKSKEVSKRLKQRRGNEAFVTHYLGDMWEVLEALKSKDEAAPSVKQAAYDLRIQMLQRWEKGDDREKSLAASRILENIFVQTSYYVPQEVRGRKDYDRLVRSLMLAAEIRPYHYVWYNLACAYALAGKPDEAIEALRTASEKGYPRMSDAATDPDLESLRGREDFQKLIPKS